MRHLLNSVPTSISSASGLKRRLKQIGFGLLAAWGFLPTFAGHRVIVINTSPSVAPGLYIRWGIEPAVGQIIDFRIPERARLYVQKRTVQDCDDWYILKPIAAGPGDRIDTTGSSLVINGCAIAPMPPDFDSAGRTLPLWRENCVLGPDEFFVFSARIPNSFDSRCYGPVHRQQIDSVRRALITW
ncbi:MAG: S26 family signal peptidase [Tepidisphaeraceae bacterium]